MTTFRTALSVEDRLRAEIATLQQLLAMNETRATAQADQAETARVLVEETRLVAEGVRVVAEETRLVAEGVRAVAEETRLVAEDARVVAEETRLVAEGARVVAEDVRLRAEDDRLLAEDVRIELAKVSASREQQRRMAHDLIAAGVDAVVVLDENYVVTYMNHQAMDELSGGQSRVGSTLLELHPDMQTTPFWPRYKRVMEERVPIAFEDFYEPRGVWYQVNAAPVGKGIAFFFRDVTERRQREAALQRTEKLAAVGRLASSISHEINNPLESVTNLLYLIQTSLSVDDATRTYAQLASSELQRVSHIVTQTLKFHRQSTDATSMRASEILEGVLALFHGRIVTLGTKVHTRYAPTDTMMCFAGDMRQVFANLIANALDATSQYGNVWLRTRAAHHPQTGAPGVKLTVADDGIGMSAVTQRSIFDAFFTTKGATGTGLGLWVSHEIIRNHNGVIRVRSCDTAGRCGTVFTVFFPD